jgi:hypothetical protein
LVSEHINMTATADLAHFIPRGQFAPRGVNLCKGRLIFCRRSASLCGLCPYASNVTYSHTKKSGGVKSRNGPITAAPVAVACDA